jgi:hypothetical protein
MKGLDHIQLGRRGPALAGHRAIFHRPSIFRNLICPLITRLKSRTTAARLTRLVINHMFS